MITTAPRGCVCASALVLSIVFAPVALSGAPGNDAPFSPGARDAASAPEAPADAVAPAPGTSVEAPAPAAAVPAPADTMLGRLAAAEGARPVFAGDAVPGAASRPATDWGALLPFLGWTGVILVLLGLAVAAGRRILPAARRRFGGDAVKLLIRRNLSGQHTVYLVEIGPRILVLGATKAGLAPLAEFRDAEDVARVRALCPGGRDDSSAVVFQDTLKSSLRAYEGGPAPAEEGERLRSAMSEIEEIKRMMAGWK